MSRAERQQNASLSVIKRFACPGARKVAFPGDPVFDQKLSHQSVGHIQYQ
jgi:hypothetical protein